MGDKQDILEVLRSDWQQIEHPRQISKFAKYHEGMSSRDVRVELLQWRIWQQGPFPLHPDAWGEQIPPQPTRSTNLLPPATPSSSDNGAGTTSSDSGGSHSVHGPTSVVQRKIISWRLKAKVKQKWLQRKKGEDRQDAPKATIEEQQTTIETTQKVTGDEGLTVSFQREKGIFQIKKGEEILGWIHLQSKIPCKDSENIQCTVPILQLFKEDMPRNLTETENKNNDGMVVALEQGQGKGENQFIVMRDNQMGQGDKIGEFNDSRSEQTSYEGDQQIEWAWDNNGPNKEENGLIVRELKDEKEEEGKWVLGLPCGPQLEEKEEELVLQMIEIEHNDNLDHGMKTPKPKRSKKQTETPVRRSARILESGNKKYYGKPPRAKGEKLEIDFKNRTEDIKATLAIELVTESGAQATEAVKKMFLQLEESNLEANKGETKTENEMGQMLVLQEVQPGNHA